LIPRYFVSLFLFTQYNATASPADSDPSPALPTTKGVEGKAFPSPEMLPSATGYTAGDVHSAREMFHPFYL
jgi:hypothetical protein